MALPVLLFFCCSPDASGADRKTTSKNAVDTISSQSEFNALMKRASQKQEVDAYLKDGTYTIEGTIPIFAKFSLRGDGAVLKQNNKILTKKDAIKETDTHYICPIENLGIFSLFLDHDGNVIRVAEDVDSNSKVNYITEDIIPIESGTSDQVSKIKIKIPENLKRLRNQSFSKAFGYLDSWWSAPIFTITHADNEYFYCDLELPRTKEQFNSYINGEKSQYKKDAAFVIFNTSPQNDRIYYTDKVVYIPKGYNEVEIINYTRKDPLFKPKEKAELLLKNINIVNSNSIVFAQNSMIGGISFENCKFRNILQEVLLTAYDAKLGKLSINHCEFLDCALIESIPIIKIIASNCNGEITNCVFNHYSSGFCFYKNVSEYIYIRKCDKLQIADNIFVNNPRGALFLWNGNVDIVSNEFYNDPTFNSFPDRNFSRDAGAIYCGKLYGENPLTNTASKASIRLNKIHDFYGKGDVNGIFIDDGRGDIICYGNLIFNGQNYSIDSRVVKSDPYSSIRNQYLYNIVEYPYRLTYGDDIPQADRPLLNGNILLFTKGTNKATRESKTDIRTPGFKIEGTDVKIDKKILKKLPKEVRDMVSLLK